MAFGLFALTLATAAHAEPPQMKEESTVPRLGVSSADGSTALALGGFLQARYALTVPAEGPVRSDLTLPRARFYAFGHVAGGRVRYRIGMGNPPDTNAIQLLDVYSEVKPSSDIRLRVGRFKIPVVREWVEAARLLASVERSAVTRSVLPGRELGAMLAGEPADGVLDYAIGVFGGSGDRPFPKPTRAPGAAARVVWNVLKHPIEGEADFTNSPPALAVGASAFSTFPSENGSDERIRIAGAEVAFRAHGLDLAMETMVREGGDRTFTRGGYVRADYFVAPLRSTLGFRVVRQVSSDPLAPTTEVSVDAGYFHLGHDLKVIADVGVARVARLWEPALAVQIQTGF
jgi:hypothetical protein